MDTNILISALLSSRDDSATVQVLNLLLAGQLIPVITEDIFQEYSDVLRRRKFGFPDDAVSMLLGEIQRRAVEVEPVHTDIELPDYKDRPFLEAMLYDDETILITGNMKHFPEHKRIMTARMFLYLLN